MQSIRSPGPECQPIRDLLSAFLDDDLSAGDRRRVEEHLGTCEDCAADLEDLRLTVGALRALPTVMPPRSFALVDPPARTSWFVTLRLATSAMAALFVLVLAINFTLPMGSATTPISAPGESTASRAVDAALQKPMQESVPAEPTEAPAKPAEAPSVMSAPVAAEQPAAEVKPAAPAPAARPPLGTPQPGTGAAAPEPSVAQDAAPTAAEPPSAKSAAAPESAPGAESLAAPPTADTGRSGTGGEAPEAANSVMSANADQSANEQTPNEQAVREPQSQPPTTAPSDPVWRVWLGLLPLVLAPLVILLGAATAVVWWRERA